MSTSDDKPDRDDAAGAEGELESRPGSNDSESSVTESDETAPSSSTPTPPETTTNETTPLHTGRTVADPPPAKTPPTRITADVARRGDFMLRWAVILLAFFVGCTEIDDTRTLVHLKTGQYLAAHGWLPPATDVFSAAAGDRAWVNLSWLFDLMLAGVFALAGATGLSLLKATVITVVIGLLVHGGRKDVSTWWGSICAALALLACLPRITALPELVTLLGVVVTVRQLMRFDMDGKAGALWILLGLFVVWANLDPRMFVGPLLLVFFAVGRELGRLTGFSSGTASGTRRGSRRTLWIAAGLGVVAMLATPYGWNVFEAIAGIYQNDYPAFRAYYVVGDDAPADAGWLQWYPLTAAVSWRWISQHTIAGLALLLAAVVTMLLDRRRFDPAYGLMAAGLFGLAMAAGHELAVASIVFAVVAVHHGQNWYRGRFAATGGSDGGGTAFSQWGRAVTVLAFFGIAMLAAAGRLAATSSRGIGLGWDPSLENHIESLAALTSDTFDDRPFNFSLGQGDLLIWLDRKPFIDQRLSLYAGEGERDLVAMHRRLRRTLRAGDDPAAWRQAFDERRITHVLPRLSGERPDYLTYRALLASRDWGLTRLGAAAAVFHRLDAGNPELIAFQRTHAENFIHDAFGIGSLIAVRTSFAELPARKVETRPEGIPAGDVRKVLDRLKESPYEFDAETMSAKLKGVRGGIELQLMHARGTRFFAVYAGAKDLLGTDDSKDGMSDDARQEAWNTTLTAFFRAFAAGGDERAAAEAFAKQALVTGIGSRTVALSDGREYPCISADDGSLYFLLPEETRSFRIALREPGTAKASTESSRPVAVRAPRTDWPRPAEGWLAPTPRPIPNSIQLARHHRWYLENRVGMHPVEYLAVAHLAIRHANAGLARDPQQAEGHRVLGDMYLLLTGVERQWAGLNASAQLLEMRSLQAIAAYNQALLIEPDHPDTHRKLFNVYRSRGKLDLALRSLRRYQALTADLVPNEGAEQERRRREAAQIEELSTALEQVTEKISQQAQDGNVIQAARLAFDNGCVLLALDQLDGDPAVLEENPGARFFRALLLTETGRAEEAFQAAVELESELRGPESNQWRRLATQAMLGHAAYEEAVSLWNAEVRELDVERVRLLLGTLPLVGSPKAWPLSQTHAGIDAIYRIPDRMSELRTKIALIELEAGRVEGARNAFERLIETEPASRFRPFAANYLQLLTGRFVSPAPPSNRIPLAPDIFTPEDPQDGKPGEKEPPEDETAK